MAPSESPGTADSATPPLADTSAPPLPDSPATAPQFPADPGPPVPGTFPEPAHEAFAPSPFGDPGSPFGGEPAESEGLGFGGGMAATTPGVRQQRPRKKWSLRDKLLLLIGLLLHLVFVAAVVMYFMGYFSPAPKTTRRPPPVPTFTPMPTVPATQAE